MKRASAVFTARRFGHAVVVLSDVDGKGFSLFAMPHPIRNASLSLGFCAERAIYDVLSRRSWSKPRPNYGPNRSTQA